ncbi:MAG: hypothetical protein ACR2PT_18760 [Endozoicomonas sp.]
MEKETVLEVLKSLADGLHPATGEIFPESSPYQHPLIIRSLYSAIHLLDVPAKKSGNRTDKPANAGKSWSADEDQALTEAFNQGLSESELAGQLQRTTFAIEARLVKLGHKEPSVNMGYALSAARAR